MAQKLIGNPLSWSVRALRDAMHHLGAVFRHVGGYSAATETPPEIRPLESSDLEYALRRGFEDFGAVRSDAVFLIVMYPIIGLALVALAMQRDLIYLVFPAITGFALLGPLAAIGLYEMSKRREAGMEASWLDAAGVFRLSTIGPIFLLGLILVVIFAIWIAVAGAIYALTLGPVFGPAGPGSWGAFLTAVFTTGAGWVMIIVGTAIGALFAVLVLGISVVSFPLLVDRDTTLAYAVLTSLRVALHNPGAIATWGVIVAGSLFLGALPLMLGLVIVMPVLGHATWHLYRRAVAVQASATAPAGDVRVEAGTAHGNRPIDPATAS